MKSDAELLCGLRDLNYSVRQAYFYSAYHGSAARDELARYLDRDLVTNAVREAALSSLRRINEFFGGMKEISVADYLGTGTEKWLFSPIDKKRIDEYALHVTLVETRSGEADWNSLFTTYLPKAATWFTEFIAQTRLALPRLFDPVLSEDVVRTERLLELHEKGFLLNQCVFESQGIGKKNR